MAEAKTQPTRASVSAYIDALPDARMRDDCRQLVTLMTRVSGASPVMWGTSIIGFDTYRYTYASGTRGDWPVIGFAPRGRDLALYLMDGFEQRAQALARLGRHTHSKSCLYVKSLANIDLNVLEAMLADSVRVMRARYPAGAATGAAASAAAGAASGAATRTSASSASAATRAQRAATASPGPAATQQVAKAPTRKTAKKAVKPAAARPAKTSARPLTKKAATNKAVQPAAEKATKRAATTAAKTTKTQAAKKTAASPAAVRRAAKQAATTATARARRT